VIEGRTVQFHIHHRNGDPRGLVRMEVVGPLTDSVVSGDELAAAGDR
jgi:hypothetical protein